MNDDITVVVAYGRGCALSIGALRGIDTASGKIRWTFGAKRIALQGPPVAVGDVFVLPHVTVKQGDDATGSEFVSDGTTVFVFSGDGNEVSALDASDGSTLWTQKMTGLAAGRLVGAENGLVFVGAPVDEGATLVVLGA